MKNVMRWIRNVTIVLVSILVSAVLVEFGARLVFSKYNNNVLIDHTYGISSQGSGYGSTCDHGWCANPGIYQNKKSVRDTGEIIYSVGYTIGDNNLRKTPKINKENSILMKYYGGSFAFGEGLNDTETLAYYSQVASPMVEAENFGFHGHGVHNAYRLLQSQEASKNGFNLLLTAVFHALRSACIPTYSANHPWYDLQGERIVYKGRCSGNKDKGWVYTMYANIDRVNIYLNSHILKVFSDFLKSSFTSYQIELYQNLIREFYTLSNERGENPIVLYMQNDDHNFFTAGFLEDPMPDYFDEQGINYIDVTLPNERVFYIHELDKHPSAFANCMRVKIITQKLGISSDRLACD